MLRDKSGAGRDLCDVEEELRSFGADLCGVDWDMDVVQGLMYVVLVMAMI